MTEEYTIPLSRIIKELSLREVHMPKTAEEILIVSRDVIRPGLELYGFCDYFDPKRITVLGRSEMAMLESLGEKKKAEAIDHFFALRPATVIVARDIDPCGYMTAAAERYDIPLLSSRDSTSNVVADLVSLLNVELAPRITRHGVLIEVYGEGILLVGDSGVGKSETAIELIKRGHRLIADDAVEIRRVSRAAPRRTSATSSSCAAWASSTPGASSVWAPLRCPRKSTCASTWRFGTPPSSTTAWASIASTPKSWASGCR